MPPFCTWGTDAMPASPSGSRAQPQFLQALQPWWGRELRVALMYRRPQGSQSPLFPSKGVRMLADTEVWPVGANGKSGPLRKVQPMSQKARLTTSGETI